MFNMDIIYQSNQIKFQYPKGLKKVKFTFRQFSLNFYIFLGDDVFNFQESDLIETLPLILNTLWPQLKIVQYILQMNLSLLSLG